MNAQISKLKILKFFVFSLLSIGIGLAFFYYFFNNSSKLIAIVGEENIYQVDLDYELSYSPIKNDQAKDLLIDKLILDSVALQSAQKEGLIVLDQSFYNHPIKDYKLRLAKINEVRDLINDKTSKFQGAYVAIWFFNNDDSGIYTYDEAKRIAFEKISKLYNLVKSKKLSIEQAGEAIKRDKSLENIDPAYQANAYLKFDVNYGEKVVFDEVFNSALYKLKPGEISNIYALRDESTRLGENVEVLYAFGTVTRNDGFPSYDFDQWLNLNKQTFEVTKLY